MDGGSTAGQSGELTVVEGWEARPGSGDARATFAAWRATGSAGGAVDDRFELLALAARGFRPPGFLRMASADAGVAVDAGPGAPATAGVDGLRLAWSVRYRRLAETGPAGPRPYAIYLLGVDPPPGATDEELAVFNDFYTTVHLVEVAERRRALRAVRYELAHADRPPRVLPRYLAVYEVDEAAAAHRRHIGPPYTPGPPVWQAHTTPWRLWYRHLGLPTVPSPDARDA